MTSGRKAAVGEEREREPPADDDAARSRFGRVLRSRFTRLRRPSEPLGAEEAAEARLGSTLRGKYRLERVLGVGGMATVYAATHRNRRRFAVKVLHPELALNRGVCARFQREGYVTNSVDHRGVVAVLDDDVADDGSPFLVMELLEGASVQELWEKRRRLPVPATLALADQLLDVLAAAHAVGVIHRDLKPANLFLTRDGVLKVLDFGVARLRDASAGHATLTGATLGTPAYMAPEQAFGRASELDAKADVWAVGATVFALISGRFVHEGESPQQVLAKLAARAPRSLASVMPGVPPAVAQVIDRALAHDKKDRWPSAAAMRDALRQAHAEAFGSALDEAGASALNELLIAHGAHSALAPGAWNESRRAKLRGRVWLAIALAVAALMVSAVALSIRAAMLRERGEVRPSRASHAGALSVVQSETRGPWRKDALTTVTRDEQGAQNE